MTLPARKLKVTYGSVSIGKDTSYVIQARDHPIHYEKDTQRLVFTFQCEVVVSETTEAAFHTSCAALEAAFDSTNKNKALTIAFDTATDETFDPATNTGFNARPSWIKPGSPEYDGPTSRLYVVRVELDLPYNEATKNGRHHTRVLIGFTDSRRRFINVSGGFTALASNQAYAQYLANVQAFAGLVQLTLGGVWEGPLNESVDADAEYDPTGGSGANNLGKTLTFKREYQELIYNNSNGGVDARMRRAQLTVDRGVEAPGDYAPGGAPIFRLQRLACRYVASVDFTQTLDLAGLYESVVKPFMVAEVQKVAGTGAIAVVFRRPDLNRTQNTISASLECLAVGASSFIRSSFTTQDDVDPGNVTVGKWTGKRFDRQRYKNPGQFVRTVEHSYEVLGDPAGGNAQQLTHVNQAPGFVFEGPNASEDALDAFFFGGSGLDDGSLATAGGVAAPSGLQPIPGRASIRLTPIIYGEPGFPQIRSTIVTKHQSFEYVVDAS